MSEQSAPLKYTPDQLWPVFQRFLPGHIIEHLLARLCKRFYRRLFPPMVVLWGFVYQRLNADHTCDAFVSYLTSGLAAEVREAAQVGDKRMSENTAAYCKARQRLPTSVALGALTHTAQAIHNELGEATLWQGRRVSLLDGSTVRLVAEPELIAYYGLPGGLHGPSHWPRLRTVAAFDLFTGAVNRVTEGPYLQTEHDLASQLIRDTEASMVYVGDQLFGIYRMVQVAVAYQHDAVFRVQASRIRRWTTTALPSGTDLDVVWSPSKWDHPEADLPAPAIPGRLIYVRLERPGFRPKHIYLFTTLTDRERYPAEVIIRLYARRWHAELNLRHIKTTLKMEMLTGKSVDIVRKEWILGLLAYNLIRGLMGQAALRADLSPLYLSFARCWRRIADTARRLPGQAAPEQIEVELTRLLDRLAHCRLPKRQRERFEPRAVWPRPHQYPYLKGSRAEAREAWIEKLRQKS